MEKHYSRDIAYSGIGTMMKFKHKNKEIDDLHISQVVVNFGGILYVINSHGVNTLKGGSPTGRGVSVFTQYESESEGIFEVQQQFHKGNVYEHCKKLAHIDYPDFENPIEMIGDTPKEALAPSQDIWRY